MKKDCDTCWIVFGWCMRCIRGPSLLADDVDNWIPRNCMYIKDEEIYENKQR